MESAFHVAPLILAVWVVDVFSLNRKDKLRLCLCVLSSLFI